MKSTVEKIYAALREVEAEVVQRYPQLGRELPEKITFIHSEELEQRYPDLSAKERENAITKEYKAVFLIGIGHPLPGSG